MKAIAASEIRGRAVPDKLLKSALGAYLENPPRRVDRLSLQALLGAAPLKPQVRADSGLYIAARYPARPNMFALLEAVCVQQRLPKPFEFVNSVSNAAGFQVAQQLGIDGPNLFIGAGERVWDDLLDLAGADLAAGLANQALLLVCDEADDDFCVQAVLLEAGGDAPGGAFGELAVGLDVTRLELTG